VAQSLQLRSNVAQSPRVGPESNGRFNVHAVLMPFNTVILHQVFGNKNDAASGA
jgi:hypothetical protein